jgi:hypothetical protein
MDDQAIRACRENCKAVCELAETVPKKGGNIERYQEILGASIPIAAEHQAEYTFCKFEGETGEEFIALQLLLDWEGMNEGTPAGTSPLLNPVFTHMGCSQKPHPKTINLFELVFIKGTGSTNNMM